jgi:hypothetical protein
MTHNHEHTKLAKGTKRLSDELDDALSRNFPRLDISTYKEDPKAVTGPVLKEMKEHLSDGHERIRSDAISIIEIGFNAGSREAQDLLINALDHHHHDVRFGTAAVLSHSNHVYADKTVKRIVEIASAELKAAAWHTPAACVLSNVVCKTGFPDEASLAMAHDSLSAAFRKEARKDGLKPFSLYMLEKTLKHTQDMIDTKSLSIPAVR